MRKYLVVRLNDTLFLLIGLIRFNEFAKQTTGEASKGAQTRALLFDISFLMLCHIMQLYGTEVSHLTAIHHETFLWPRLVLRQIFLACTAVT